MGWLESFKKDSQDKNSQIGQKFLISSLVKKLAEKLEQAIIACCSYDYSRDYTMCVVPRLSGELDLLFLEPKLVSFYQEYLDLNEGEKELVLKEFKDLFRLTLEDVAVAPLKSCSRCNKKFPAIRITLNGVTIEPEKRNQYISPLDIFNITDSMLTEYEKKNYVGLQRVVLKFLIQAKKDFYTSSVKDDWRELLEKLNRDMPSIEEGNSNFFKGYISKEGALFIKAKEMNSMPKYLSIDVWGSPRERDEKRRNCLPVRYIKGLQRELHYLEYDRYKTTVDNVAKDDGWLVDFYYNLDLFKGIYFYGLCLRTREEQSPPLCQEVDTKNSLRINARSVYEALTCYLDLTNWTPLEEFKGVLNQGENHVRLH